MQRLPPIVAALLALGLSSACTAPGPRGARQDAKPALPPRAETCEGPDSAALRLLLSSGEPPLEIDCVLLSELGCRVVASGRRGTLWWEDAWAESNPEELAGRATGLSADGKVLTGRDRALDGSSMAWWRSEARGRSYLGRLDQDRGAEARAVSADGLVVVGVSGPSAFRWQAETGMQALPPLASGASAEAVATSTDGSVSVGHGRNPHGNPEALLWLGPSVLALGDLPGGIFASQATALSSDGTVVVGVSDSGSGRSAFRWTFEAGMEALACPGGEPAGACGFQPRAVTNGGTLVAGCIEERGEQVAVVWSEDRGTVRLADLLQGPVGLDLEGWTLTCATDLSASGLVLAGPGRNPAGVSGAWLARLR